MVERWLQLPLDHALSYAARVRTLVHSLADAVAREDMTNAAPVDAPGAAKAVPDLGPATLMDQLTVMVYDASTAGLTGTLAEDLASLRRELR